MLIGANLVPLWSVLALDWAVLDVMVLFWAENVVLGVINVVRMLVGAPHQPGEGLVNVILAPFFAAHYGIFCAVQGALVFALSGGATVSARVDPGDPTHVVRLLADRGLALPLAALTVSHLFSFFWNFVGRGEYRHAGMSMLMRRP